MSAPFSAPPGGLSFSENATVSTDTSKNNSARLTVTHNPILGIFHVLKVPEYSLGHTLLSSSEICNLKISEGASPLSPGVFYCVAKYSYLDTDRLDPDRHISCYILKTPINKHVIKNAVGKFMSFTVSQDDELFKTFFSAFCKVFGIKLSAEQDGGISAMGTSIEFPGLEFLFYKDEHTVYLTVDGKRVSREYAIYSVMIRDVLSPIVPNDLVGVARTFPSRLFGSSERCELYHLYIRENAETSDIIWLNKEYKFKYKSSTFHYNATTDRMEYLDPNNHLTILRK